LVLGRVPPTKLSAELGLLDRREVFSLNVLDQVDFHHLVVRVLPDHHRYDVETGLLGGAVSSFADYDFKMRVRRTNDNRLEKPLLADASREVIQSSLGELQARVELVRLDLL